MLDNAMNDYDFDPDLCECTRLISNTFTINSAGISPASRQREQRTRGRQIRMTAAPQHVNFDIKCDSPGKENMSDDISFYTSAMGPASSPRPCPISPCRGDEMALLSPGSSPSMFTIENNVQLLNSQHDSSSMDSGFGGSSNSRLSHASTVQSAFTFAQPKRPNETSPTSHQRTPSKYSIATSTITSGSLIASGNSQRSTFKVFHSLSSGSMESMDDDYMDLIDMESIDEDAQLPTDLSSLICKDIKSSSKMTPDNKRPSSYVRKCLNMDDSASVKNRLFNSPTPPKNTSITSLITTPERQCLQSISDNVTPYGNRNVSTGAFKRPEPPTMSPIQSKRYKSENEPPTAPILMPLPTQPNVRRPIFRKSMSMNDAVIMNALSRSSSEPNLIGDFSKPYSLPLIDGRHSDLRSISANTMRRLLSGEFDDNIASYRVIDCRYPYEFNGGHIQGALNLYTQEQILDELVNNKTMAPQVAVDGNKRHVLIFHCEFSSERGPKLSRFLRNTDRQSNTDSYPALHYPEIYLLHGGYKEFFENNSDLCDPIAYRPMLEPEFSEEYKLFRAKSKSWTGDIRASASNRLTKSRSRLVL